MTKKLLIMGITLIMTAAVVTGYTAHKSPLSGLFQANIEALTQSETEESTYKLVVCLCSNRDISTGYYQFSEMKTHCHQGVGKGCSGDYTCLYTWYCGL